VGGYFTNFNSTGRQYIVRLNGGPASSAPTIDTHPVSQSVTNGVAVTFTVLASGPGTLSYVWKHNNVVIPGATAPSLTVTNVDLGDVGAYVVTVANSAGSVVSLPAVLTVNGVSTPDLSGPTFKVTSPAGTFVVVTTNQYEFKGTAADNQGLGVLAYKQDTNPWTPIPLTTNWAFTVNLHPGTNLFLLTVGDTSGNYAATQRVTVFYSVPHPLGLNVVGNGKVNGATNGQLFEIGRSVTLTATPGTGWILTNWLVQVNGSTTLTTNKAVPFLMASNTVLTATFADLAKPTLTITAPTINQRWSNEVFTVRGKVTDNNTNGTVWYQLNGGTWTNASGWTNWSVVVSLIPGTNNIRAFAQDAAGNRSTTNSVNCIRVLTAPFCLSIIGNGKVTGATNNQPLELGKSYLLTTTPGTGWILTNWLVQVEGNTVINTNKAAAFQMQSNLCVTATFADIAKPTLTITAPTANQRWSNEVFTVRGKVTDNNTNGTVWYQLNGGTWTNASGWTNWSAVVNLIPGTNNVKAFAVDAGGNKSATNSVNCIRVLTAPFCLNIVGNGKVTGATNNQPLELGKSYLLTTTPGTGWILTNWLVQVEGNTVINTNKAAAFQMQSNLCVTATFADIAKPTLTITTPTLNQRTSNEVFNVTGKVTDNNTNGAVKYQLNGGAWTDASGWTNWSATVVLTPGTNVLKAFAVDAAGNRSTTNSVTCLYVLSYCLADYYYPTPQDSRFIYDGLDWDGSPAQLEVKISDTNHPLLTYSGTSPVTSYTQAVIRVESAYGFYNTNTDVFTPYDDWHEYFVRGDCSFGFFGSDDDSESIRVGNGAIFTNRIAVGQTLSLTRNLYTNGAYAGQGTLKLQLLDVSSVTVPAGTFPGCLRIRLTLTAGGSTQSHDDWLAPGLGMVKQQGVSGDGAAERWALIKWQLDSSSSASAKAATTAPPPSLRLVPNGAGGHSLVLSGQPGATYVIETTGSVSGSSQWTPLWSGTLEGAMTEVPITLTAPAGFYRARRE
jgi:hypothetical protein